MIDCLSTKDDGSKAQQALSSILGIDVPLDAGVDLAASSVAEKLGLKSDRSLVQSAIFVITKAAILEGAQLIGIGGGLAKGDLGGFQMAQMMKKLDEINQKIDVVLAVPLKEAVIQLSQGEAFACTRIAIVKKGLSVGEPLLLVGEFGVRWQSHR